MIGPHAGRPVIRDNVDGTYSVLCCRRHLLYSRLQVADGWAWVQFRHPDALVTCNWPEGGFSLSRRQPDA